MTLLDLLKLNNGAKINSIFNTIKSDINLLQVQKSIIEPSNVAKSIRSKCSIFAKKLVLIIDKNNGVG